MVVRILVGVGRVFARLFLFAILISAICHADGPNDPLVVVKDGKYGYIDHEGKVLIPPQFVWADDFWRGLGTVYICGRYLSIDSSGALHPLRSVLKGQLERKNSGEKVGFIDATGAFKIPPTFDEALPFSEGLAAVRVGEKWGFIDTGGKIAIEPKFEATFYFREGVGVVMTDSKPAWALIDKTGNVIASIDYVDLIADGRVPAARGEKRGFLDLQGKVAIPFVYDGVNAFSGGLAAVEKGEKWGYVDRDGNLVIPPKFDQAGPFGNGLAPTKLGKQSGFIDKSGKFVFSLAFDYAPGFLTGDEESDLLVAPADVSRFWTRDNRFGYVNTSGRVIWGPAEGSPDHPPLFGWSEDDKVRSCEGFPDSTKSAVASFSDR
jgi:hypothetical protein